MECMILNCLFIYDFFKNMLEMFNIEFKEVVINNFLDGIFYVCLICIKDGEIIEVDFCIFDVFVMVVCFDCLIYIYEFIFDVVGVVLEDEGDEDMGEFVEVEMFERKVSFFFYFVEDFCKMLDEVFSEENYEWAVEIWDEIDWCQQEL